LINP